MLLPLAFFQTSNWLARERGPVWLGTNSDPSYQYLLNSLLVLHGQPPGHVDHPGTTLQILGAAVLRMTVSARDQEERTFAVLSDPETALARLHLVLLGLSSAVIALAGLVVLQRHNSVLAAWVIQLLPLLQVGTYRSTLFFDPEALLVPITMLLVALLVVRESTVESERRERTDTLLNIGIGLLAGAGVVTKVTFAPLCLLPLFIQRSWRGVLVTAGAIAFGVALYLTPVWSELPRILKWFEQLATHSGTYGSGEAGFIDLRTFLGNLLMLATADRLLAVLVPAGFGIGLAALLSRPTNPRIKRPARLLVVISLTQALAVLLIAKHPHARYLVPVALSCTLNAVFLLEIARAWPHRAVRPTGFALLAAGALVAMILVRGDLQRQAEDLGRNRIAQFDQNARANSVAANGIRVDYYRSSSVSFALYFGNNSAWRYFARPLSQIYPRQVFFHIWAGLFEDFSGPIAPSVLFRNDPIYLVGNGEIERLPRGKRLPRPVGWELTRVDQVDEQTIHRLQPSR
jgi:hypothetical protein